MPKSILNIKVDAQGNVHVACLMVAFALRDEANFLIGLDYGIWSCRGHSQSKDRAIVSYEVSVLEEHKEWREGYLRREHDEQVWPHWHRLMTAAVGDMAKASKSSEQEAQQCRK